MRQAPTGDTGRFIHDIALQMDSLRAISCILSTISPSVMSYQARTADSEQAIAGDNITMMRTQISLSESEYEAARREAQRLGISFAELLRRALRMMLPGDDSRPWMRYAGLVETGDSHSSQCIDDIVYGQKD